jgi:hypothetical protein
LLRGCRRGLYRRLFDRIMSVNGKPALKLFSPTYCIKVGLLCARSAPLHTCPSGWCECPSCFQDLR